MNGTIIEAMAIEAQTHTQTRVEVWKPEGLTDKPFQPEFLMETNSKHGGGGGIFEWQWSGSARSEWSILRARARHLSGLGAPLAAPVVWRSRTDRCGRVHAWLQCACPAFRKHAQKYQSSDELTSQHRIGIAKSSKGVKNQEATTESMAGVGLR